MGACISRRQFPNDRLPNLKACASGDDPIPKLHKELSKDLKRVFGDSVLMRAKISRRVLSKADLQRAFDFVELQMLLPRKNCIDTQVLALSAPQLACCGMLLQQPSLSNQGSYVQNVCLHILFEPQPLSLEANGVALANLARLLTGNTSLETLNLNLMGLTAGHANIATRKVYAGVMETFAVMLCSNSTLRLLRFEGMIGRHDEVPWHEADAELVCKAQAAHRCSIRLAFLMAQHPRCYKASPLPRLLPRDVVQRILDLAAPVRPLCKVEFDFFREDHFIEELGGIPGLL